MISRAIELRTTGDLINMGGNWIKSNKDTRKRNVSSSMYSCNMNYELYYKVLLQGKMIKGMMTLSDSFPLKMGQITSILIQKEISSEALINV